MNILQNKKSAPAGTKQEEKKTSQSAEIGKGNKKTKKPIVSNDTRKLHRKPNKKQRLLFKIVFLELF